MKAIEALGGALPLEAKQFADRARALIQQWRDDPYLSTQSVPGVDTCSRSPL